MELWMIGLFGAACLTGGYLAGSVRAQYMHRKTVQLLDKLDQAMAEYNSLRDDIEMMIENGEEIK